MSFWKAAGEMAKKAGSVALNEINAAGERSKQYKEEMPSMGDDELFRIMKNERTSSPMKSGAALQELRGRGYSNEEIKSRIG